MAGIEITVYCMFCSEAHKAKAPAPPGWTVRYGAIDAENGMCPRHSGAEKFFKDQCPGCVSGFPECGLARAFMYSTTREPLTASEFVQIESGVCPRRVNGTFMVTNNPPAPVNIEEANISERATTEAGMVLSGAIREYVAKWSKP